jgi:hypothetical protein
LPDINGTNSNDTINVDNDSGTLNGGTAVSPVDNIRGRRGEDDVTINDSTISGTVNTGRNDDTIVITDSTIVGRVSSGADNDVVSVAGSSVGDIRMGRGDDTLNFMSTTVTDDISGNAGTDSLNLPAGTVVTDATAGTFTVVTGVSYTVTSGTFTLPSGITVTYTAFENGTGMACFARGVLLKTPQGDRPIENLAIGDTVLTRGNGPQAIRWIGKRQIGAHEMETNPKLRPVRIVAGALGGGYPERDLVVSRQHRMFVQSRIAERMFSQSDVLIAAIKLTELPGIFVDNQIDEVAYFHLAFDHHEVIFAEGAPTESLLSGPEAMASLSRAAKEELLTIFPQLADASEVPQSACFIPAGHLQRQLIKRHHKNNKPLLSESHTSFG